MNLLQVRRLLSDETAARFGPAGPSGPRSGLPVRFAVIDDADRGVLVCAARGPQPSLAAAAMRKTVTAQPRTDIVIPLRAAGPGGRNRVTVRAAAVAEVLRAAESDPRYRIASAALLNRLRSCAAPVYFLGDRHQLVYAAIPDGPRGPGGCRSPGA